MKKSITILLLFSINIVSAFAQGPKQTSKSSETSERFEIPFTLTFGKIIIQTEINKRGQYNFIFDTGTQGFIIDDSLANALNLKSEGFEIVRSPNDTVGQKVKTVQVAELTVAKFPCQQKEGLALDMQQLCPIPNVVGIIGLDAFKGYTLIINYPQSKLVVSRDYLQASDSSVLALNLSPIFETTFLLNAKQTPTHFDSGSPEYITLPMEWKDQLKLKAEPVFLTKARVASGEVEIYKAQMIGTIQVGHLKLIDPEITFITGGFTAANFGYRFLKDYIITIDTVHNLFRIDAAN
ncbi:MAG: aspartyl protease family protein [Bacteroidia bacterium]